MQFVYACELRLRGDPAPLYAGACDLIRDWQEHRVGKIAMGDADGEVWPTDDVMVQWRSLGERPTRLWRYVIEHPGDDDEWIWRTTIWVGEQLGAVS